MRSDEIQDNGCWSIGLLRGPSLDCLNSTSCPIVTANDFKCLGGTTVADPFAIFRGGTWYLFFELIQKGSDHAVIAASSSQDLVNWEHLGIVLRQPHHLSYPFVFEYDGEIFMMPESKSVQRVDLYRAVEFPMKWVFEKTILRGKFMDCSMVEHQGRFWIFAGWRSYWLKLFYASNPLGPWKTHAMPFIRPYSRTSTRPGGRPIIQDKTLIRFSQDCKKHYGHQLRAWNVTSMNRLWYSEKPLFEKPILSGSGHGWNARCMHHIDAFQMTSKQPEHLEPHWIAFVDGCP